MFSFLYRFEKYETDGEMFHAFAGYMTVYNYYAYPERIRPRIRLELEVGPLLLAGQCVVPVSIRNSTVL